MKIAVFGVYHWLNEPPTQEQIDYCKDWEARIHKHIGECEIFVTTGTYSDPKFSPFSKNIPIIQNGCPPTQKYSVDHNYFRNGFMTGIWHALLNIKDYDILYHVQTRVKIGDNLTSHLQEFIKLENCSVMAPRFASNLGTLIEISCMAMKPSAVLAYATQGLRATFTPPDSNTMSCEQEAYLMFYQTWYNPWPHVITTRQLDPDQRGLPHPFYSAFTISESTEINKLPMISTGKHILDKFSQQWEQQHPL